MIFHSASVLVFLKYSFLQGASEMAIQLAEKFREFSLLARLASADPRRLEELMKTFRADGLPMHVFAMYVQDGTRNHQPWGFAFLCQITSVLLSSPSFFTHAFYLFSTFALLIGDYEKLFGVTPLFFTELTEFLSRHPSIAWIHACKNTGEHAKAADWLKQLGVAETGQLERRKARDHSSCAIFALSTSVLT